MRELNDPADLAAHLAGEKKTVVFFEMSGCPYCVAYQGRFAELMGERSADLDFLRVKLDDPRNPLWNEYAIRAVPTFIAFERGNIVARADSILALGIPRRRWAEFLAAL
jgi:thiol-disulfide isomerase/thioredoxin